MINENGHRTMSLCYFSDSSNGNGARSRADHKQVSMSVNGSVEMEQH